MILYKKMYYKETLKSSSKIIPSFEYENNEK